MNFFKFPLLALFVLSIVSCSTSSEFEEEVALYENTEEVSSTKLTATEFEMEVFNAVNDYRVSIGLNALTFSETALPDAEEHTDYMISKGKISHDNFNKRASKIAKKTNAKQVSENVAKKYDSAQEVLEAWLNSTSHRNTIEGEFTHSTLSAKKDATGEYYFTHIFLNK